MRRASFTRRAANGRRARNIRPIPWVGCRLFERRFPQGLEAPSQKTSRSSGGAQARVSTASPSPREAGASACPGRRSRAPSLEAASGIELISEKHGALYSVSRLRVRFADNVRSFAVNCALSPEQQAFLQVEVKLLSHLNARFGLPWLPLPVMSAKAPLLGHLSGAHFMLFIADWFENHHEFHLSLDATGAPAISVWKQGEAPHFLSAAKAAELYRQASGMLTSCLDTGSFSQVYPWHHAAGDFVLDESQNPPSIRLITVRGYRPLLARKSDARDKMLGSLHFFVNLSIRMRIDRLDGTGALAWAGPECLPGVIRGFVEAWEAKSLKDKDLPKACEIFSLLLDCSPDERLAFAQVAAEDGRVEAGDGDFLLLRLPGHVIELSEELRSF